MAVHVFRRDPVKQSIKPVQDVAIEPKAGNPLAVTATLAAGEELLVIGEIGAFHTAASVTLRALKAVQK